jgi:hypothetical protein
MPILRYLSIFLASALVASYAALWLANPAPLEQLHSVAPAASLARLGTSTRLRDP